jgi:peptidylprolyl isomerase
MLRLFLALALAGCSPTSHGSTPDLAENPDLIAPYQVPAGYTLTPFLSDQPVRSFASPEPVTQPGVDYQAVMETDVGTMTLDLDETDTPITVNSFVWLALHHFYDGLAFHRVIDGFVAQGGDPNTASGDPSTWGTGDPGYSFGLEIVASLTYDGPGVLGMARSNDPNSNGSQFFITLAAAHSLDGMYTIFGKVTVGLDVLPNIARGMPPATPTRMQRVYIVQK